MFPTVPPDPLGRAPGHARRSATAGRARASREVATVAVLAFAVGAMLPSIWQLHHAGGAVADRPGGAWSAVQPWPIIAIHAVLNPDGTLLTFGADGDSINATGTGPKRHDTWSPRIGLHATVAQDRQDYFCSATVVVPDTGRVLIAGGDDLLTGARGNAFASFYDPAIGRVVDGPDMGSARWYATATTLPDGRILVQGGRGADNADAALVPEVLGDGTWTDLPGASSFEAYGLVGEERRWWYPRAFVDPYGDVFTIAHSTMFTLDASGDGGIAFHGEMPEGWRGGATSSAVMYAPGMILQVGGGGESNSIGGPALASAAIIDITSGTPVVTPVAPMNHARHWANATVLPDGQVLVNGGSAVNNELVDVAYPAELWDPRTRAWTVVAAEARARLYHSSSVLLADGRVYSGGGGAPGPVANLDAQFFTPPYLLDEAGARRARPRIDGAPAALAYGGRFGMRAAGAARVTLVKTGATTHSFNMDQRFVELDFTADGDRLSVEAPAGPNAATPGYYLLSVIDADGVVSESTIVRLLNGTAPADAEPAEDGPSDGPADGPIEPAENAPAGAPTTPTAPTVPTIGADAGTAKREPAGGCSLAGTGRSDGSLALLTGLAGLGALRRRRRGCGASAG